MNITVEELIQDIKEEASGQKELAQTYAEDGAEGTAWACERCARILETIAKEAEEA